MVKALAAPSRPLPAGGDSRVWTSADNPTNNSDPTGLNLFDDIVGGISQVAGVVATVADASGIGAPLGLIAGGISTAASVVGAVGDCSGIGDASCGGATASSAVTAATAGTAAGAAEGSGLQVGADLVSNLNDGSTSNGVYG